jgi:hypothetical protein
VSVAASAYPTILSSASIATHESPVATNSLMIQRPETRTTFSPRLPGAPVKFNCVRGEGAIVKRTTGRNVFVNDLARVIGRKDPGDFARACIEARLKGV